MKIEELKDALIPPEWRRDLSDPGMWLAAIGFSFVAVFAVAGLLMGGETWL